MGSHMVKRCGFPCRLYTLWPRHICLVRKRLKLTRGSFICIMSPNDIMGDVCGARKEESNVIRRLLQPGFPIYLHRRQSYALQHIVLLNDLHHCGSFTRRSSTGARSRDICGNGQRVGALVDGANAIHIPIMLLKNAPAAVLTMAGPRSLPVATVGVDDHGPAFGGFSPGRTMWWSRM